MDSGELDLFLIGRDPLFIQVLSNRLGWEVLLNFNILIPYLAKGRAEHSSLNRHRRELISVCGSCLVADKDELPGEVATSFELRLGLRIEIFVIGSNSSVNHLTHSKFELSEVPG